MALKIGTKLPEAFLKSEIQNESGASVEIEKVIQGKPTLLLFIRHFGCIGCADQMIALKPRLEEFHKLGIQVIAIGNGDAHFIDGFKERLDLNNKPIQIYTDPSRNAFDQANLHRSIWRILHPITFLQYVQAFSKGIGYKPTEGDNLQLGGTMFIDQNNQLEYFFQNKSVSGHTDPTSMMQFVQKFIAKNQLNKLRHGS